jgi:hypothetical protein
MQNLFKKVRETFKLYSKKEIESADTLYTAKHIQIWRLRISWYRYLQEGLHYDCKF